MRSIHLIVLLIISACILPYIFAFIARVKSGYNAKLHGNIREHLAQQTGLASRANAVQQNSFESLPIFLTSVLLAEYLVVPAYYILKLGVLYLICRIFYGISYLANWHGLRSAFWASSMICCGFLFYLSWRVV